MGDTLQSYVRKDELTGQKFEKKKYNSVEKGEMVILDNLSVLSDLKNEHQSDEVIDQSQDGLSQSDGSIKFRDIN